jgi:hypothetical protein
MADDPDRFAFSVGGDHGGATFLPARRADIAAAGSTAIEADRSPRPATRLETVTSADAIGST